MPSSTGSLSKVTSDIFVGREEQLTEFRRFIENLASNVRVLNVHSRGDGGIGKTQLLRRMQDICESLSAKILFTRILLDFYHIEARSKLGLMCLIIRQLGASSCFVKFEAVVKKYHATQDASERDTLFPQIEAFFKEEYTEFSKTNEKIVLFFDTYEVLQPQSSSNGNGKAETNRFLAWIETIIFPFLAKHANTRIVVAGRYPLRLINRSECPVQEIELRNLSYPEAITFWNTCFGETSVDRLLQRIGIEKEEQLQILYDLAKGHPILLALITDWIQYAHAKQPFSIKALCNKVTQTTGNLAQPVSKKQQEEFERELIAWVSSLVDLESQAITLMAVAYHRMTPEIFQHLTGGTPIETSRKTLLEILKPLSFIKYKEGDIVLLHDEMRRLILQHYWKQHDPARSVRRETIAEPLLQFYDQQLLAKEGLDESEREIYFSERLPYAFLAKGIEEFCNEFDIALENGQYDYADLLLREAEKYHAENPEDIPLADYLNIPLRRIREYTRTDKDYQKALDNADAILEDVQYRRVLQENSQLHGHFLMERGVAEFYLEYFDRAINHWQEANKAFRQIFLDTGDDYWGYRTNNWIGYAYYRQAMFPEAEKELHRSRRGFYNILVTRGKELSPREWRDLLQGLHLTHVNLATVYSHTGQFEEAIRYGEVALDIVRYLPRNNHEIARDHNALGYAFARAGSLVNAREHLAEAEKLLETIGSRLIAGRVKTNLGFLAYRVNELAELLEFHRAEEIHKIIDEYVRPKQAQVMDAIEFIKGTEEMEGAIGILSRPPVIKKELADAYYHLGWFHTISSAENHWQEAEQALLEGLEWGKASKFQYRVVSLAESLVNLYYFWNQHEKLDSACREMDRLSQEEKRRLCEEKEEESFSRKDKDQEQGFHYDIRYPNLFGKYELVLGNIAFDQALPELHPEHAGDFERGIKDLKEAFTHYVSAAFLMQQFNESQYYFALQVFYSRLCTLIEKARQREISIGVIEPGRLSDLQTSVWGKQTTQFKDIAEEERRKFDQILKYAMLRIQPTSGQIEIEDLKDHTQRVFNKGNYAWAIILTDSLIGVYRALLSQDSKNETLREALILELERQAGMYREVREKYQGTQYWYEAESELQKLLESPLKQALGSYLLTRRSTLDYRRGEYGRLLDLHLQNEIEEARHNFDSQFGIGTRQRNLQAFQQSEKHLTKTTIPDWEKRFNETENVDEKSRLEGYLKRFYDLQFRISEYLILEGRFDEALAYLKQIISDAHDIGYAYREVNAMQRYISALYFAERFDDDPKRLEYEEELTQKALTLAPRQKRYPSAVGRLRITQGNDKFSKYFYRQVNVTGEYGYYPRQKEDKSGIRAILACYIEACNFMAQHSSTNFELAIRILQRRIKQIADKDSLEVIQQSLLTLWNEQEHLKGRDEERIILDQFTRLRSFII